MGVQTGGPRGVCHPIPSAGQTESPQGRGGHHRWMGETVHQNFREALRHRWALPAMPPFHASWDQGHRKPGAEAAWAPGAQRTLTLANTAGFDLHAVHRHVPGDTVAPPGSVYLLKESHGGHRAPQHRGPHSTLPPEAWDISTRDGNPWLEATSAGPGPMPQRWAGTVPPNTDRDSSAGPCPPAMQPVSPGG